MDMPEPYMTRRECAREMDTARENLTRIQQKVEGPPHPGIEARLNTFITTFEATETLRHEENQNQLAQLNLKLGRRSLWVAVGMLALAFASLCAAMAGIAVTYYVAKHANIEPMDLFQQVSHSALSLAQRNVVSDLPSLE